MIQRTKLNPRHAWPFPTKDKPAKPAPKAKKPKLPALPDAPF
jgi:hypothetical protein